MKIDDLSGLVAAQRGNTKVDARKAISAVFNGLAEGLTKEGDSMIISGFGTFSIVKTAARKGRNPSTGKEIQIPEKLSMKFKQSSIMKKCLN